MPAQTPEEISPCSSQGHLDLILPIPDAPLPRYHDRPLASIYARNDEVMRETHYDEAYFAASLARKNPEPFVM